MPLRPSRFTVRVPLPAGDTFVFNTLTDAQAVVSAECDAAMFSGAPVDERSTGLDEAAGTLADLGFLVQSPQDDDRSIAAHFDALRESRAELRVTVLTTLRCNFGCDYCVQGDHAPGAAHMSLADAARLADWIDRELDDVRPERLVLTFFGGEPLLNLPVVFLLAERAHAGAAERGVTVHLDLITNGLLLTPDVVDRLSAFGLRNVKVTLDGDRDTHDRQRPLRGGQGTFDRIVENLRAVAGKCRLSIGGNVDADALDDCTRLLDRLASEPFASSLVHVSFKPVVRRTATDPRVIPLLAQRSDGTVRPVATSACDTCAFSADAYSTLRRETDRRGLPGPDGVHMGPCELHRRHAHAIGPDGTTYVCPGFAGERTHATGHLWRSATPVERSMAARRDAIGAWRSCGDCAFVPVCAGGCSVAAHHELHDMERPACHRPMFEAAVADLAISLTTKEDLS